MKNFTLILFIISLFMCSCKSVKGYDSSKNEIVSVADKVADWQIKNFSYRESGNLHDYGIDAWTNGVLYLGMSKWAEISPNKQKYNNWLYHEIGEKNNWKIPGNFLNYPKYSYYHADELCVAQFYINFYNKQREEKMIASTVARLDSIIANPTEFDMSYQNKKRWSWCDALFMAPPVYLGIYNIKKDDIYLDYMHNNFLDTYNHLFDKEENLFFRDDSYFEKREENGEKIFWGRGNGWVIAGLANIIDQLPEDSKLKPFYIDLFQKMASRLAQLQHNDGFWHASLLDPDSYPSPETSATALITYAFAYGINNGILDKKEYNAPLMKAWKSLLSAVNEEGKLGWVQPIGADPKKVTEDMTAVYGVGAFLMTATEIYKMK